MKRSFLIVLFLSLITLSCTDTEHTKSHLAKIEILQAKVDSLKNVLALNENTTENQIIPFFTFQDNNAENAMNFYVELFDNSKIINVQRWGKESPVGEGKVMHATFNLNGKLFMCSDSPPVHDWDFSPAISNYYECKTEGELERLFLKLSENGTITMPLNNYGFSKRFGWVIDQFGISWQLNLK